MAEKFVPREKMGKKAKKVLNNEKRRLWDCSPVQKVVESRKVYDRKRAKLYDRRKTGDGAFLICA